MSKPEQANEPTMEEILASIRRIISDDDQESGAAAAEAESEQTASEMTAPALEMDADSAPEGPGHSDDSGEMEALAETGMAEDDFGAADGAGEDEMDVLELTEEVADPDEAATSGMAASPAADEEEGDGEEDDIVFLEKTEEEMDAEFDAEVERLQGMEIDAAPPVAAKKPVEERGLLSSNADSSVASAFSSLENFVLSTHSRTLEDLVQEMLRPMLKDWLDANLPPLVERLVREEIERVSRGGH